jgi:gamma-glutamyltranspeptidase/glutathione hydrolase
MNEKGVVAAGHELTAAAAETILREGGNAYDAILAAALMSCVTEPVLASLGGGGFLLAHTADDRELAYDFFAHTPRTRRPVDELDFQEVSIDFGTAQQPFHIGLGSIATPGMVRGLFEIHRELGTMSMRDIAAQAVEQARRGVRLNRLQAYIFGIIAPIYTHTPDARAIFGSAEDPRRTVGEGEVLVQPQLADVLEVLAIEGEDLFYRGETARAAAEQCQTGGGCLTSEDLEHYVVERRRPLVAAYRGTRLSTNPPPSSGGILIAFGLQMLQAAPRPRGYAFGSAAHLGLMALVMDLTDRARIDSFVDGHPPQPAAKLLDGELIERYRTEVRDRAQALGGTTHINVMDAAGNVATMTTSNGEGCGHIVPGTGLMLNNMLGEEDLHPSGFHNWRENERMTSMMAPSVLQFPDGRIVATGSGGSRRIRTALLQVLVNLVDHGMGVEEAVTSPRIVIEDDKLSVEGGFEPRALDELLVAHPNHQVWDELNLYFGGAHTVELHRKGFHGAGDPRRGGVCVVVR